ncbi:MAG: hypothetical protein ONA90_01740, partial [candidate division KSB1 bacterium]|nr:hypothetical protein [candidate division KSB1 bacterium]
MANLCPVLRHYAFTCIAAIGVCISSHNSWAQRTLVHAGTLIDGLANTPRTNVTIIIEKGRINSIEAGFVA